MSGFKRILLTVATLAMVPVVVNAWSAAAMAQSRDADVEGTQSVNSPADEPVLLAPRPASNGTKPAAMKSTTNRTDNADSPTLRYGSYKAAAVATRTAPVASTKRPSSTRVISAAKFDEPAPVEADSPKPIKSKSSRSASAQPVPEPQYDAAFSPSYESSYEPAPVIGPNPGYHPARVPRYLGAGWTLASMQAKPAPGEMVPAPEPYEGPEQPYMPYGGNGDGTFDEGFDEGYDPGYDGGGEAFGNYALPGRRYAWLAGGEGLLLRPHFSQATAMTESTTTPSGNGTILSQDLINFNPGYQGAFRTYLGVRNCACGDEIRFTFLNFNTAQNLGATATSNMGVCDFLCNTTPNPGDSVSTRFGLGVSLWDLDCIRPFFCVPPCNNPCGPQCHPWDLRWFAGLRFAYINQNISSTVTDAAAAGGIFTQAGAANKFTGFGPRIGLQGRKYFGQNGRLSVYTRGAGSLLVGNDYQSVSNYSPVGDVPTGTNLVSRNSRIIPVAEIEIGATWWMLPRFAVSGGWMLMSFWDLGMQATGNIGATPNLDDSNILGFDGFFVRGELVF